MSIFYIYLLLYGPFQNKFKFLYFFLLPDLLEKFWRGGLEAEGYTREKILVILTLNKRIILLKNLSKIDLNIENRFFKTYF